MPSDRAQSEPVTRPPLAVITEALRWAIETGGPQKVVERQAVLTMLLRGDLVIQ